MERKEETDEGKVFQYLAHRTATRELADDRALQAHKHNSL